MENITKSQFDEACNKHLPNAWIKFAYKFFSKDTVDKDITLNKFIVYLLITTFALGFLGTIFKMPEKFIRIATIAYSCVLGLLVLFIFSAVILNNIRINKICKELGINTSEYQELIEKYIS